VLVCYPPKLASFFRRFGQPAHLTFLFFIHVFWPFWASGGLCSSGFSPFYARDLWHL